MKWMFEMFCSAKCLFYFIYIIFFFFFSLQPESWLLQYYLWLLFLRFWCFILLASSEIYMMCVCSQLQCLRCAMCEKFELDISNTKTENIKKKRFFLTVMPIFPASIRIWWYFFFCLTLMYIATDITYYTLLYIIAVLLAMIPMKNSHPHCNFLYFKIKSKRKKKKCWYSTLIWYILLLFIFRIFAACRSIC